VDDSSPPGPDSNGDARATVSHRIVALLEVLICSDYPTQLAVASTFAAFGYAPSGAGGTLNLSFVAGVSALDTAFLLTLILAFLYAHGERPRDVLFGFHSLAAEAALGIPLTLVALGLAAAVLLLVQAFAPALHSVEHNPLQSLMQTPRDAWVFALVVVVAGGVREELQRAFQLHRFTRWLGGGHVGILVTSVAFGAGHLSVQGKDAAIATGLLGAFWGIVYLRRRSAVAPMVSHAGFNLLQIGQFLVLKHL
jgi:membrane protease YdiL (CAAX protease family)